MARWLTLVFIAAMTAPLFAAESVAVSIQCRATAGAAPSLRLTIENTGDAPATILLGRAFANGRWHDLRDLTLLVTRPQQLTPEEFPYRSRLAPTGVAGRIDHWLVTLPPNSAYSQTLALVDFFSPVRGIRLTEFPSPSEIAVRLVGKPVTDDLNVDMTGLRSVRYWTGTATSASVKVPDDCRS